MTDREPKDRQKSSGALFVFLLVGLPLLLFAPLLLSFAEHTTLGSDHVEGFCRTIGIHGLLSKIYEPIIEVVDRLF